MEPRTPQPSKQVGRAILFADMGGSTRLYDRLGDVEAHRIAGECLDRIARVVATGGGTLVKTIGDEVMATFETADAASAAACEIQSVTTGDQTGEDGAYPVHVGFHYGEVIEEAGDVFGDAVNVAARMVALAREGEILTTRPTVELLCEFERARTRQVDRRALKGKREAVDVFEVIWQTAELTALHPLPSRETETAALCVVLQTANGRVELSPERPEIHIGRALDSEIVVSDQRASRHHATIVLRGDKFVLYDASTNGTICHPRGAEPIVLRREEMILPAAGTISIGVEESPYRRPPITFHTEPWWPEQAQREDAV